MPFNVEAKLKQRIMLVEVLSLGVVTGRNSSRIWHVRSNLGMQCSKGVF